ncbi:MAG TPA: glutathione S-transferase family protein, partial [Gammaproteobacteria bacterium]|nr:glutathione S-transferase family protein [Gammaproteobacteria bacterium]
MSDLILHHYWPSPFAHKIRLALGLVDTSWKSVEIPRVPPKPLLMPLTAGYRRTPVLQNGADIYCDTQNIVRAISELTAT